MCGAVRFKAYEVETDFGACHCVMCQRWAGGPFFGTDKLTNSPTGSWDFRAPFDLKTRSGRTLASTYRALQPPSSSAIPRLRVNLSGPCKALPGIGSHPYMASMV